MGNNSEKMLRDLSAHTFTKEFSKWIFSYEENFKKAHFFEIILGKYIF